MKSFATVLIGLVLLSGCDNADTTPEATVTRTITLEAFSPRHTPISSLAARLESRQHQLGEDFKVEWIKPVELLEYDDFTRPLFERQQRGEQLYVAKVWFDQPSHIKVNYRIFTPDLSKVVHILPEDFRVTSS